MKKLQQIDFRDMNGRLFWSTIDTNVSDEELIEKRRRVAPKTTLIYPTYDLYEIRAVMEIRHYVNWWIWPSTEKIMWITVIDKEYGLPVANQSTIAAICANIQNVLEAYPRRRCVVKHMESTS